MRLTLVTPGYAADESDDCIPALRMLVRALAERHRVDVLALRYPTPARCYELEGARVTALGAGDAFGVGRLRLLARAGRWLGRRARAGEIDVVHALWADEPGWLAIRLERRCRVPALVSLLGGELACLRELGYGHQCYRVPRWLVSRTLHRARSLTVGSRWLRERLREWSRSRAGLDAIALEARVRIAPLGIEPAQLEETTAPSGFGLEPRGTPNLLAVGSLTPVKGHATLLRAFARASSRLPDPCLHLVGEGPLRADLVSLARELGVASRVHFHGALPHATLPTLYRSADACVLASHWESQSLVALEAAACARVTLGSAVGSLPELAPPEALARPGDPDALAEIFARIGSRPDTCRSLGARARTLAIPRFGLAATVAGFEAALDQATRARPGDTPEDP